MRTGHAFDKDQSYFVGSMFMRRVKLVIFFLAVSRYPAESLEKGESADYMLISPLSFFFFHFALHSGPFARIMLEDE